MQAAVFYGVDGIVAECGGSCMCATCHVYVREDQLAKAPSMEADEDAMLEGTASPRRPNSRLSCQLVVSPEMDGLVVDLPETQTMSPAAQPRLPRIWLGEPRRLLWRAQVVVIVGASHAGFQLAARCASRL